MVQAAQNRIANAASSLEASLRVRKNDEPSQKSGANSRQEILRAAARCFMQHGFAAASIDDVARELGATKGMIYHHFRSKTDLFFEVYRQGMAINFAAIRPHSEGESNALDRLTLMGLAHTIALLEEQAFQRVLAQGVAMHQQGSTTAAQREALVELIDSRNSYETMFRSTIEAATKEAGLSVNDLSIASKSFLAVLNSTVFWYSPRQDNPKAERATLAFELVSYALKGLGTTMPEAANEFLEQYENG